MKELIRFKDEVYVRDYDSGAEEKLTVEGHVTIPCGVENIANGTFEEFENIEYVTIPETVKRIEAFAFSNCKSLRGIVIPKGVEYVDCSAFYGCFNLDSPIVVGETLYRSARCNGVGYVPDGVTIISEGAFGGFESLTEVVIPNGVRRIKDKAFGGCINLKVVNIPDSVDELGNQIFMCCPSLEKPVVHHGVLLSEAVIDGRAIIPEGVREIQDNLFSGNDEVRHVALPDSVEKIGYHAFDGCCNLETIEIPSGVYDFSYLCFTGCFHLKEVRYGGARSDLDLTYFDYEMWAFNPCKIVCSDDIEYVGPICCDGKLSQPLGYGKDSLGFYFVLGMETGFGGVRRHSRYTGCRFNEIVLDNSNSGITLIATRVLDTWNLWRYRNPEVLGEMLDYVPSDYDRLGGRILEKVCGLTGGSAADVLEKYKARN